MAATEPTHAWYLRDGRLDGRFWQARCFLDDRFPDGHIVDPDGARAGDAGDLSDTLEIWRTSLDPAGHLVITVNDWAAPDAPDLWYVVLREPGDRPATSLVAYSTPHFVPGAVVEDHEFFPLPVRNDEQVAALRWWHEEATVDQVFVSRAYRRSHAATKIIYAASSFHQANGWRGRLHSDGRRTELGEQLVVGMRHSVRIAPWTEPIEPMDTDT